MSTFPRDEGLGLPYGARKGRTLDSPLRGPKNRRPRVLPVPDALAAWIEQHVSRETLLQGGPLFVNPRTGKAWAPTSFRRTWAKACKAAGLPVLKPYETLRHSTATEWMRRGASEREVQEFLGHRTRHATPRYAWLADERLESIVGRRRDDGVARGHSLAPVALRGLAAAGRWCGRTVH